MSSRWSYGPEGLRERPTRRWSEAERWPRWRELQPLLIRSAGVVGIAATIMAVVSSDAWRFGGDVALVGRNDRAEYPPGVEAPPQAIVAAASELSAKGSVAPRAPPPVKVAAVEPAPSVPPAIMPVAPVQGLSSEPAQQPAEARAASPPAGMVETAPVPSPAAAVPIADLRRDGMPTQLAGPAPITTASVSASDGVPGGSPPPAAVAPEAAPAPLASILEDAADSAAGPSVWSEGATCPRDWVASDTAANNAGGAGCSPTPEFVASTGEGAQSLLEDAAAARAESLAALAPRIPTPRPDAVPAVKPARVARASSDGSLGPPPNCGAGHSAKWHYVDRKAGSREWYCR